ncbi:MAG: hypothetical protein ACRC68_08820, partial [Clostridium sp.]
MDRLEKERANSLAAIFDKFGVIVPKNCSTIGVNLGWDGANTTTFRFYCSLGDDISRRTVDQRANSKTDYRICAKTVDRFRIVRKNDDGLTMTGTINLKEEPMTKHADFNTVFTVNPSMPKIKLKNIPVGNGFKHGSEYYMKIDDSSIGNNVIRFGPRDGKSGMDDIIDVA